MVTQFVVTSAHGWSAEHGWVRTFKLQNSDRLSSVIESDQRWQTEAEAQAVCDRVNAGDLSGLAFASYADD
jgi:hypothetical protein